MIKPEKKKSLTLAPVKFNDAIAAALETPPERKKNVPSKKKRHR